jgi:hypothetical protein
MLHVLLAACAILIFVLVLAVPHAAEARRLARLFRAQQKWAEMTDRHEEGKRNVTDTTVLRAASLGDTHVNA